MSKLALLAALAAPASAEQPVVRFFTTEDGLVRNWITRIRRDTHERLWFCTVEGLSMFDGDHFTNYTVADGLPNRMVNDFLDVGGGNYWIATGSGIYRFRPRKGQGKDTAPSFIPVPLHAAASQREVNVFLKTRSGDIWTGTADGLYRNENAASEFLASPLDDAAHAALSMVEGGDGSIWVGTYDGLFRRRPDGRVSRINSVPAWDAVRALFLDRRGRLWVGANQILVFDATSDPPLELARYEKTNGRPIGTVEALSESSNGDIWVAATGLLRVARTAAPTQDWRFSWFDSASALGSQNISALAGDAEGNLWAGVSTMGAARILRPALTFFTEADGLPNRFVLSVFEDREGKLFAVTGAQHTLNEFDGERFSPITPRWPPRATAFGWGEGPVTIQDRRGEWWMATAAGLVRFPAVPRAADLAAVKPKALYTTRDGLPGLYVLRLFEDPRGDIWIGTNEGLARWSSATHSIENLAPEISKLFARENVPYSFTASRSGEIWIGFYPGGLVRYDHGRFEEIRGAPAGTINSLLTDHQGRLWIGSSRGGLGSVDAPDTPSPQIRSYTMTDGLASNHLFALAEDHTGRIYIAGGQGVDRFDPATGASTHFRSATGLPPAEVQRLFCDRQGAIWFASDYGLSRYLPEAESTAAPPAPVVHAVRVSGVPAMISDEGEAAADGISLSRDASIEIAYGAIDFSVDRKARYQYRLRPVDTDWRKPTDQHSVQYARLGPAAYRFEVRTLSTAGVVSAATAALVFRITPPVWQTWWFLLLVGAAAAALIYAAHTYRLRHILALQRIRTRLASDLHDEVGSGLAEIAILAEVTKQNREPDPDTLSAVANRARELRGTMSDIVWSVNPSLDHVSDLVRRFRQTASNMLGATHTVEFSAPSEQELAGIDLMPDRRRHLLLLFKEALTNITSHAQATRVWIKVRIERDVLLLKIADDGLGFAPSATKTGHGLASMSYRASELHATLDIASQPGRGTTVSVQAPL